MEIVSHVVYYFVMMFRATSFCILESADGVSDVSLVVFTNVIEVNFGSKVERSLFS